MTERSVYVLFYGDITGGIPFIARVLKFDSIGVELEDFGDFRRPGQTTLEAVWAVDDGAVGGVAVSYFDCGAKGISVMMRPLQHEISSKVVAYCGAQGGDDVSDLLLPLLPVAVVVKIRLRVPRASGWILLTDLPPHVYLRERL